MHIPRAVDNVRQMWLSGRKVTFLCTAYRKKVHETNPCSFAVLRSSKAWRIIDASLPVPATWLLARDQPLAAICSHFTNMHSLRPSRTRHRNRWNLEPALILALTKIRPRIEVLACQKQAKNAALDLREGNWLIILKWILEERVVGMWGFVKLAQNYIMEYGIIDLEV
jgi:hypothetical protein